MLPEEMKGKKIELQVAIKGDDGKETYIPLGTGFQEVEVNENPEREIDIISTEFNAGGDWNSEIEYRVSEDGKRLYINKTHFSLVNIDKELRDELHDVCGRIVKNLTEKQ
ncbi:hypothetical protein [Bacillus sp. SB47]|uniref:hypothetical protein n=1 Tax=Bacillus sp. SB47 TaxID=1071079 RepID=UPI0003FFD489|nr:hypothetical protein [Bacillus sp. SB47]